MQVRVEQVAAHLTAYANTLPIITALRLCNRFGTGNDCHVNKLPIELVELIGEHVVVPEREASLEFYSGSLRCNEGRCKPLDHYTQEEIYDAYHNSYGCVDQKCVPRHVDDHIECAHGACTGDKCPAWKYDHDLDLKVREQLEKGSVIDDENVRVRCWKWQDVLGERPVFAEQEELLESRFGIDVWAEGWRPEGMHDVHRTFTAYLTLAKSGFRHEEWDDGLGREFVGYGIPIHIAPPTGHSLSRFPRALKILGLQAWAHPRLEGRSILSTPVAGRTITVSDIDVKDVAQPQLTLLVRSD